MLKFQVRSGVPLILGWDVVSDRLAHEKALIRDNMDKLAENITIEQGKTLADAKGDVFRGLGRPLRATRQCH
jgi:hypothetical protein